MCGIAGVADLAGRVPDRQLLENMAAAIKHRGPDDSGVYSAPGAGLAHRRLSIIDTSPAGRQPMANEDGTVWISYNGEIYNFLDIRAELLELGHVFRSKTDTEAALHAYEEWGPACLERFNGMFALAIWDSRRRTMFLARDRLGKKPLFYTQVKDRFLFGSEIKAILADPDVPREIDFGALPYFLAMNWTPAPFTLFAGIRQLLPGHYMEITQAGARSSRFWELKYDEDLLRGVPDNEITERFSALLDDSVKIRLVSDVPFGSFLSGGLDSSAVSRLMTEHLEQPLRSFSVHFGEPSFDEDRYARLAADHIGSDHHQMKVAADIEDALPRIVRHAEEPTADSSMAAVYHLARETSKHVKMVLTGDGADETLAGYETYQAYFAYTLYRSLPRPLRLKAAPKLVSLLPVSDAKVSWDFKLRQFVSFGDLAPEDAFASCRMIFFPDQRKRLLRPAAGKHGIDNDILDLYREMFRESSARDPLNRLLYVDTRFYLPNDMLVKVDRMCMAHSLEARVPFLDYRLVEFAASVPPRLKLNNFTKKKYILKKAMQGKLPEETLRRKKQGFNVPNARWIKNELKSFVTDHLSKEQLGRMGFLDAEYTGELLADHFSGKADNSHRIWALLTLSLWWQEFIQNNNS